MTLFNSICFINFSKNVFYFLLGLIVEIQPDRISKNRFYGTVESGIFLSDLEQETINSYLGVDFISRKVSYIFVYYPYMRAYICESAGEREGFAPRCARGTRSRTEINTYSKCLFDGIEVKL